MEYETLNESQKRAVDQWNDENPDYEYQDNHRYAVPGTDSEWEYEDRRNRGCCGSVDVILQCDDGCQLMYGFNYGH